MKQDAGGSLKRMELLSAVPVKVAGQKEAGPPGMGGPAGLNRMRKTPLARLVKGHDFSYSVVPIKPIESTGL